MTKLSKQTRNNLLNALLIIGTMGIVVWLGVRSGDIGYAIEALRAVDARWLLAAFACWALHAFCEGLVTHAFLTLQHIRVPLGSSLLIGLIGMFYSCVTPAATGGQPMQVFAYRKRGVSPGVSSSALAVKFFCFQTALLLIGGIMWITHPQALTASPWLVVLGFFLNGLSVGAVFLLALSPNIVRAIIVLIISLGAKLHIVKDRARASSRADAALYDFNVSVDMIRHKPKDLIVLLLISGAEVLSLMSAIYFVYLSFGLSGASYESMLTAQLLLYIAASFTPLPGASGAQEGGFYLFFKGYFPEGTLLAALFLWRFFTYYVSILGGMTAVIIDSARSMRAHKRDASAEVNTKE